MNQIEQQQWKKKRFLSHIFAFKTILLQISIPVPSLSSPPLPTSSPHPTLIHSSERMRPPMGESTKCQIT